MRDCADPPGVDFSPVRTTIPDNIANPVKSANSQFGVESNQLNDDTIPNLEMKAKMDLLAKVRGQANG